MAHLAHKKRPAAVKPKAKAPSHVSRRPTTARRPAYMQTKMAVSHPADAEEREADQVARQVSRSPRAVNPASLEPAITPEKDEESLAPSPVPAARQIRRVEEEAAEPQIARQGGEEEEEVHPRLARQQAPEDEQSLQARIFRQAPTDEEAELQTRLHRQEVPQEEEALQTRLFRQEMPEEEEETLQTRIFRQAAPEEEEPIQTRLFRQETEEEEALQTRPLRRDEQRDEQNQTTEEGDTMAGKTLDGSTEERIEAQRGLGAALPAAALADMEERFGKDFSGVRVHIDAEAAELCARVRARAFTVGSDVFFAPGEFAPETDQGRDLLAHELTHVVQQGAGAERRVARNGPSTGGTGGTGTGSGSGTPATPAEKASAEGATLTGNELSHPTLGKIDRHAHVATLRSIDLPRVKKPFTQAPFTIPKGRTRGDTQTATWNSAVEGSAGPRTRLQEKIAGAPEMLVGSERNYYLKLHGERQFVIGTENAILDRTKRPFWNNRGQFRTYDVDHKREFQLGGDDAIDNYWLLESSANRSSGSKINNEVNNKIESLLELSRKVWPANLVPGSPRSVRTRYDVTVEAQGADMPIAGQPTDHWTLDQVGGSGDHLNGLDVLNARQIAHYNLQGSPGRIVIYSNPHGGRPAQIPWGEDRTSIQLTSDPGWGFSGRDSEAGIQFTSLTYNEGGTGSVEGLAFSRNKYVNGMSFSWPIVPVDGVVHGGAIQPPGGWVRNKLTAKGFSPVIVEEESLEPGTGIVVRGHIVSDLPILSGAELSMSLVGSDVELSADIPVEDLHLPSPITITHSSIRLFAGTRGFGAEGSAGFEIERLGQGELTVGMSSEAGFNAEGSFDFDPNLFDEASLRAWYRNGAYGAEGRLAINEGKVPGIRSASVQARFEEGAFSAEGTVQPDVPGVESGDLRVSYSEAAGLAIGGTLNLSGDVPGIRGGQLSADVREKPDGSGYAVHATGEAQPAIPGINSNLHVEYDDGAFTAEVTADYSRGMLSGQIRAGVTNRGVGEDGQLTATAAPGNPLIVFGGGQATIQIAPWLQGTAGIRFDPNGEVTVSGEIGLPGEVQIFPRKEIDKSIFSIAVQAPIFPGIVAEVGGGLSAQAGIGPGVIDQLRLGIEYNPAHEENTHVTGDAHLNIPADAGLRLSVRAGIGLGITGASATGGLEIGGTLGIEGAAEAGVHLDWTPTTGLDIRAEVAVHAQPSFTFDISGYVAVTALGFSVYDNRWELASYTFGSDYRFGIRLPIHYHEGEPFDISLSDVEFEVPDIDTNQLLRGLIDRIA